VYSIPGALANRQKYTGQEHRVAGTKNARTGKTSGMWLEETNQKEGKKVQTKDVEEAIKAYDGIVEVGEGSGVQGKRGKALWSVMWVWSGS